MTSSIQENLYPGVPEVLRQYYPGGYYGYDRNGRPVFYQPLGQIDFKGILHSVKTEELLNYKRLQCEHAKQECKSQEEILGKSLGKCSTVVLDLEGFTRKHLWMPGLKSYQKIIDLLEQEYPDGCEHVFMINAPSIFQSMFSLMRLFLGKNSKEKIKMLGNDWRTTLQNYISPDNIPMHYGGNCKDKNGSPKCEQFISYGGLVPESYYVTKNMNIDNFENVKIKHGKKLEIKKEITDRNTRIEYKFMTMDHDIGFMVECIRENNEREIIIEFSKVSPQYVMEVAEIKCSDIGTYIFTFDNEHSWMKVKELWYSIEVTSLQ